MNPKVFISHASEDKERFVLDFAQKLRKSGVDAWYDDWEIKLGESLVKKIFSDGLGSSEGVAIILSSYSVEKPWVKEEIDSAFVKKVQEKVRLFPIILDDCVIPECLDHLKYIRIKNIENYSKEFEEILSTIFNSEIRPPLGPPPSYVTAPIQPIPGLTKQDTIILKIIYDYSIKTGDFNIDISEIKPELIKYGISDTDCEETLTLLHEDGYIKGEFITGFPIAFFQITVQGFLLYSKKWIPNFETITHDVIIFIVNNNPQTNEEISEGIGQPRMIVDNILQWLSYQGLVKISEEICGCIVLIEFSPKLKRMVSN